MKKRFLQSVQGIAICAALAAVVTACGGGAEPAASSESQETQAAGQEGEKATQESAGAENVEGTGEQAESQEKQEGQEDAGAESEDAKGGEAEDPAAGAAESEAGTGKQAQLTSTQSGTAPSEKLKTVFAQHDQESDQLTELNANAPERSYSYWGTGLSAEEERAMINGMNSNFKSAVLSKAVSQDGIRYYADNVFTDKNDRYYYTGNIYKLLMEAAEAGVIQKEDAELCILANVLWTDKLGEDLLEELLPKVYPYAREKHAAELEKDSSSTNLLGNAFRVFTGGSASSNAVMAAPEAGLAVEEAAEDLGYDSFAADADTPPSGGNLGGQEKTGIEADFNTTEYNVINENGFRSVAASPLSTFSIDVDTAGYTKVKYDILRGSEIVKDEVKIEELINYFNFDYRADRVQDEPFIVSTDYTACPWNKAHQLLRIGIKADDVDQPDTNFVLVADVSGSMLSLNKLPLALNAYADMLEAFDGKDKISLMYYADGDGVILDGVSCDDKGKIFDGLAETLFVAGGGTYGEAGLNTAYQMAKNNLIANGVNRVLLATDGDFNIGRTSSTEMKEIAEQGRKDGVYLTILGYGFENLKDNKMETMAENGHGNYYYIGDSADARKALVDEAASTLIPVADDVKIQVEFNPEVVQEYRLIGYESRILNAEDFNNDAVTASQIGSGKSVTALYEIVPAGAGAETSTPDLKYSTVTGNGSSDVCNVAVRYKGLNSSLTGEASRLIEKKVPKEAFAEVPDDNTALAISLAEFGMVLRNSEYKGTATLTSAEAIADAVLSDTNNSLVASYLELIRTLKANSR